MATETHARLDSEATAPELFEPADLRTALAWLDDLLVRAVAAAERDYGPEAAHDPYRGLYVEPDEPARLLARPPGASPFATTDECPELPDPYAGPARLRALVAAFGLSPFEYALVLLALAPEIDLRYQRIYAFLQDDVTRKWPSVDLALGLLCPGLGAKLAARRSFAPDAPLRRFQLLRLPADPHQIDPPLLSRFLRLDDQVAAFLLGDDSLDPGLAPYAQVFPVDLVALSGPHPLSPSPARGRGGTPVYGRTMPTPETNAYADASGPPENAASSGGDPTGRSGQVWHGQPSGLASPSGESGGDPNGRTTGQAWHGQPSSRPSPACGRGAGGEGHQPPAWAGLILPTDLSARLAELGRAWAAGAAGPICYLQGADGTGRRSVARALCRDLGYDLLLVDGARLAQGDEPGFLALLTIIERELRLRGAALYWQAFDALLDERLADRRDALLRMLAALPTPVFLAGDTPWEPGDELAALPFTRLVFPLPDYPARVELWRRALAALPAPQAPAEALASAFRFSGGQIVAAAATVASLARRRSPADTLPNMDDLFAACRLQSSQRLAGLARQVTPHYRWADIVLPAEQLAQLRAICAQVRYRGLVYDEWGFGGKLALGKGLNVLFAGPSGTGKTMAAEIIAGELGLELYTIDLASVVSKYIGETEKNLARIFAAAAASNAILFFDEADALFGKRSEVKDAHDRYANIEVGYLLQQIEAYAGVVILATNLRRNMDEAFTRRLHLSVQFPLPEVAERRQIWERIWPAATPRAAGLDLDFLAKQFKLAGGNIKNIALAAAFQAAEDGRVVTMQHLVLATRGELKKTGKAVVPGDFGTYAGLLNGHTVEA